MTNKNAEVQAADEDAKRPVDVLVMQSYEIEGIALFREMEPKLSAYTDEQVRNMYRAWSNETASAGWLSVTRHGAKAFCEWAFTYPADMYSA